MAPSSMSLRPSVSRNERTDDNDLADLVLVRHRLAGADRTVGAEDQEPLEIRMRLRIWSIAVL